mmetsp:Transcript_25014/g.70210  ORF Transcript_25014/g.70210 Transcript_25014/m.70210 type:complete len:631 (-) Transcript_25014:114-2006(-)
MKGTEEQEQANEDGRENADGNEDGSSGALKTPDSNTEDDSDSNEESLRMRRRGAVTAAFAPFDESYHPGALLFYSRPRQRQRWGDQQILPRLNWGDLFFDLFYVAAAYNTSNILVDSPSAEGLLYFVTTFVSVMQVWQLRMYFDGCYVVGDDLYHRFLELFGLCALASAVVHIRTVDVMSNPKENVEMFAFSVSIAVARAIMMLRQVELYQYGIGDPALKTVAVRDTLYNTLSISFLLAAAIISGLEFFGDDDNNNYDGADANYDSGKMRFLAGDSAGKDTGYASYETSTTDLPIWLLLIAFFAHFGLFSGHVIFCFPKNGEHKKIVVPMNVDFSIHRHGEWTMLMLGESILSLLIVDVPYENDDYFATFYCGLITVAMLQYLHFRSQPHHADGHAMRRKKNAGIGFSWFTFLYSLALIALGAGLTIFVLDFSYNSNRRLELEGTAERFLAGGGESKYDQDELRTRGARLFSGSLAIIFLSLDAMSLLHVGIESSKKRCVCRSTKKKNLKGYTLILFRFGTIVAAATLGEWLSDVAQLAEAGLAITMFQIFLRLLGNKYFPDPGARDHAHADAHGGGNHDDGHDNEVPILDGPWQDAAKLVAEEDDSDDSDEDEVMNHQPDEGIAQDARA